MTAPTAAPETLADYTLPNLLFQPVDAVERLQDSLLAQMMSLCASNHPYYSRLLMERGLDPAAFSTIEALEDFPLTSKSDFLADPEAFRLRPDGLAIDEQVIAQVFYTTGTTSGIPAPVYNTSFDRKAFLYHCTTRAEITGLRGDDVILNLFPLTEFPTGGYLRLVDDAAAMGAALVFGHTGRTSGPFPTHRSTREVIELAVRHRATVLWGVPGYIRRLLITAAEMGADLSTVRTVMLAGEAISQAGMDDLARRLREFGSPNPRVVNRYASTEGGTSMVECSPGTGLHDLSPDQVYLEAVDPGTGRRVPDGEWGALAITHLARRGTVLLRYLVGDEVVLDHSPCPACGRTSLRIVDGPRRSGSMVKIKGMLVNLAAVTQLLERRSDVVEHQIVVAADHDGLETRPGSALVVRIALQDDVSAETIEEITREIRSVTNVTPEIEMIDRDEIFDPDAEFKARRIVIER